MPHKENVSSCSGDKLSTLMGKDARVAASIPPGTTCIRLFVDWERARQRAAWKLLLMAMVPRRHSACTFFCRLSPSASGEPKSASVPVISITEVKQRPLLCSSTRGEKLAAHSSNAARAVSSCARERCNMLTAGNISISRRVMARSTPRIWAARLHAHTCSKGGSPSSTATGLSCSSGRRRSKACRGNCFTSRQA